MKIIFASESPRRRELLEMMGIKFETKPSNSDETIEEKFYRDRIPEIYADAFLYHTSDKKEKIMPKSAGCKMQFADFLYFALIVRAGCYIIVKKTMDGENI